MTLRPNNLPSGRLKKDFGEVDEAMFQGVKGYKNTFYVCRASKKATLIESLRDVLSRRMDMITHKLPSERLKTRLW
jgi:hypothetical protein